ncbi:glycosyltransferase [Candidimonas nitroreducens]|uniref:glycosyltransferase n=1 Tax=Candidimonas nitroreducens TaxID=683354 RepID=UPI001303A880|nr:glycosyltransferase [Candidimonas nitroreducens]
MVEANVKGKKPRLAFVVDVRGWAFDLVAKNLQEKLSHHFDVQIFYWEDYPSHVQLVKAAVRSRVIHLHFFFREHLNIILETGLPESREMADLAKIVVSTHVPDYLYSSLGELAQRHSLFTYADGYFTTNRDLFEIYSEAKIIPKPDGVIFDWPSIPNIKNRASEDNGEVVRIVWCGNSKWGEYAGHTDYKGLKEIILPAVHEIQSKHPFVQFICMDSAQKRISHENVLQGLVEADVLLIASIAEGTPLTFIEGIASSCAVVSSPIGIVREVLPKEQHRYIVPRSSSEFFCALDHLVQDRTALIEAKRQNRDTYVLHFGEGSPLLDKWLKFLANARYRHGVDGGKRKAEAIRSGASPIRRMAIRAARRSAALVKKWGLEKKINDLSPAFGIAYGKLLHGRAQKVGIGIPEQQVIYQSIFSDIEEDKPVVVYAPMWKGVAASTEALFQRNLVRFPFLDSEYPEVSRHEFLDQFCEIMSEKKPLCIIYSGGSALHMEVARILKEKFFTETTQYFLWHGSPAQWVEPSQFAHFLAWESLYRNRIIDGIITVKPGLEKTLEKMGISSCGTCNPIPDLSKYKRANYHGERDAWNIGVFSALSSWYKNPHVQVLALAGMSDVCLHTNLGEFEFDELGLNLKDIKKYSHMPRAKFLSVLSTLDINLYVTNTECSPMIALESWAIGLPCIVGPAGDVYSSVSKKLGEYLVEPQVDSPNAIYERVQLVCRNINEIQFLLEENRPKYDEIAMRSFAKLMLYVSARGAAITR